MSALADARWHWTVEAYEAAVASGAFGPEPKIELLDGEVLAVTPMLPGHAHAVGVLDTLARRQLDPDLWSVGCQTPVRLTDDSEPEPDLWIARGGLGTYRRRHAGPADLVLAVEVADTSLALDRDVKVPRYLAAGVPEVWLVALPERTVTVHTPTEVRVLGSGDTATHGMTGLSVPVAEIL